MRAPSVIVTIIILIGGNGQTGSDFVIGIRSLPRAIDRAVRGTNYSILSVSDCYQLLLDSARATIAIANDI